MFVPHGQAEQDQRTEQGEQPQPGVQQAGNDEEDRHPGQVEQGDQGRAGKELAQRVEITEHLCRVGVVLLEALLKGYAKQSLTKVGIDTGAHLDHHLATNPLHQ